MGFESMGAFRKVEVAEYEQFLKGVESTIREVSTRSDDDVLKQEMKKDLESSKKNFNSNFNLPWGHRNIIKSIIEHSKTPPPSIPTYYVIDNPPLMSTASSSSALLSESSNTSPRELQKECEIFMDLCQRHVTDDLIKGLIARRDLYVYANENGKENDFFVDCPFCELALKLIINKGAHRTWNFQRHLIDIHKTLPYSTPKKTSESGQKVNVQKIEVINTKDGDKPGENSKTGVGGSSELSPPSKVQLIGGDSVQKKVPLKVDTNVNEVR